jgi:hypothetical protein
MKWSYIPTTAAILAFSTMISAQAQPDTVVLNSTEFRFPETHPGRVFVVKKVVVNGQQSLKKGVETGNPASTGLSAPASAASVSKPKRDAMGRVLKSGEYAKRMANIQKAHRLPTVAARSGEKAGQATDASEGHLFQMTENARFELISNSPLIRNAKDLVRMEKQERAAVWRKYGSLGAAFTERVSAMREGDSLDVVIELVQEHPGYLNSRTTTQEERIRNARAWVNARPIVSPRDFLALHGLKEAARRGKPRPNARLAEARASKSQILGLKHARDVVSIIERKKPEVNSVGGPHSPLYTELYHAAYNPASAMAEYPYSDIKVATMETGLGSGYVNRLPNDLKPVFYDSGQWTASGLHSVHSEGCYQLLAAGTRSMEKYHYNDDHVGNIQTRLLEDGINVLSSSLVGDWGSPSESDSRAVDNLAFIYPYPLVSLTAGNDGPDYAPDAQTYNSLIVGNVQHYDSSHYQMDFDYIRWDSVLGFLPVYVAGTQWKNPPAQYAYTRDWELPTLVAPGFGSDPYWGLHFPGVWTSSTGVAGCAPGVDWCPPGGTSFSAPVAAALAAQIIGWAGQYASPNRITETKAILMLTAENVDGDYWKPHYEDSRDGAGTVSGANAVEFVRNAPYTHNEMGPHIRAMRSGYLSPEEFGDELFIAESLLVPATIPTGKHLRVVLTWTSSPSINATPAVNEVSDMGLFVHSNYGWRYSETWNSNTEIVDLPNASLTPNGTYVIKVFPQVHRSASDGVEGTYYTLAWTWVKDHAD